MAKKRSAEELNGWEDKEEKNSATKRANGAEEPSKKKKKKSDKKEKKQSKKPKTSTANGEADDSMVINIITSSASNGNGLHSDKKKKKNKDDKKKEKTDKKSKKSDREEEEEEEDIETLNHKRKLLALEHAEVDEDEEEEEPERDEEEQESIPPATNIDGPPISNFRVSPETVEVLRSRGFNVLFPIQAQTYDHIFDGKDLIGRAKTGSGKTLSFALPVVERLQNHMKSETGGESLSGYQPKRGRAPRVICLSPTRELAKQIAKEFDAIGRYLTTVCIYGGAPYAPQENALRMGVDIVVGTPGRVKDHIERGTLRLENIEYVILDEADEMLNIGFEKDVEQILSSAPPPERRQTLLFSATIPSWVQSIARKHMRSSSSKDGVCVTVDLVGESRHTTPAQVRHMAICCPPSVRQATLADVVKVYGGNGRTIVFANTKAEANELALQSSLRNACQVLHGDIAQAQRELTLQSFRDGQFNCLVATDVAARGLDIPNVDLIIQCEPPRDIETYIHRSGRTGRAGRSGSCITFFANRSIFMLSRLERAIGTKFERIGTPQPEDLVKATADSVGEKLDAVHHTMIPLFLEKAKELIAKKGAAEALAAAMATITGYTQPIKVSFVLSLFLFLSLSLSLHYLSVFFVLYLFSLFC
ncbi:Nucleolar RNA helicase 2 [Balamuthia mandrillaris]